MRITRYILSLCLMVLVTPAAAQSTVLQAGAWTPGHSPMYVTGSTAIPAIQDSGPAGGGGVGLGFAEELLVARGTGTAPFSAQGTGPLGTNFCDYDAPITNTTGYHYLCMSPNISGNAELVYGSAGGATPGSFIFNINGTSYTFPFTATGVVGPNSSTAGDLALWNNSAGTLLKDAAMSQDCTMTSAGVITCLKTNNVAFGTSATINTGTSGATIPLLNGSVIWSGALEQFGAAAGSPTHVSTAQLTAPALTTCGGGSPAITGTDHAGIVTMGTSATGCVITFNTPYVAAPYCVVSWIASPLASQSYAVSTTAITLTQTSTSTNKVNYICVGQAGG